jgi:hypothetical protein
VRKLIFKLKFEAGSMAKAFKRKQRLIVYARKDNLQQNQLQWTKKKENAL